MSPRHFDAGATAVVEGKSGVGFFTILEGTAIVTVGDEEVRRLGPGDYFGERGLLDNAPRNATVTTAEPSTLLRLDGDVLLEALQTAPAMRSALDRSNVPGRSSAPPPPTALVDDPAWS